MKKTCQPIHAALAHTELFLRHRTTEVRCIYHACGASRWRNDAGKLNSIYDGRGDASREVMLTRIADRAVLQDEFGDGRHCRYELARQMLLCQRDQNLPPVDFTGLEERFREQAERDGLSEEADPGAYSAARIAFCIQQGAKMEEARTARIKRSKALAETIALALTELSRFCMDGECLPTLESLAEAEQRAKEERKVREAERERRLQVVEKIREEVKAYTEEAFAEGYFAAEGDPKGICIKTNSYGEDYATVEVHPHRDSHSSIRVTLPSERFPDTITTCEVGWYGTTAPVGEAAAFLEAYTIAVHIAEAANRIRERLLVEAGLTDTLRPAE